MQVSRGGLLSLLPCGVAPWRVKPSAAQTAAGRMVRRGFSFSFCQHRTLARRSFSFSVFQQQTLECKVGEPLSLAQAQKEKCLG